MTVAAQEIGARPAITRVDLLTAFLKVGVLGFGGVAAWVRHITVVERRWLSEVEFTELFGIASTLPGANTVNFATMFGDRSCGPSGAVAALTGLLAAPLLILVGVASLYARYSGVEDVKAALAGAAAAAAGLVIGTSLKMLRTLANDAIILLIAGLVFAAAALARLPILTILLVAIPAGVGAVMVRQRRRP